MLDELYHWSTSIQGLDAARLPPEGITVNVETGALSYRVGSEGAVIHLSPADALRIAQALVQYAKRYLDLAEADVGGRA